jgi:hypothetical protein
MIDDVITRFAERLDAEPWPPLPSDGAQIRRHGRRRRLQHRVAYVGGVGAVAVAVVAVPLSVARWHDGPASDQAATSIVPGEVEDLFGVTVTLPAGWEAREVADPAGDQWRSCLGPAPVDPTSCAVTVLVTNRPEQGYQSGIDWADLLASGCSGPEMPPQLQLTHTRGFLVDGRKAEEYVSRCSDDDPLTFTWFLDNNSFGLRSEGPPWDDDARWIFEHARTPEAWSHEDAQTDPTGG